VPGFTGEEKGEQGEWKITDREREKGAGEGEGEGKEGM